MSILQERLHKSWASDSIQSLTSTIGTITIFYLVYRFLTFSWLFLRPSRLHNFDHFQSGHFRSGSWALVTGSSDGIGQAFAEELLSRGFNVLLHGRNHAKLSRLVSRLASDYPGRGVDMVVADASRSDDSYNNVVEKVKTLPGRLTVLINNVGGISTKEQYICHSAVSDADIDTVINLNARFPTHLTKNLLPILTENAPSLIFNAGSTGALVGVPYIVTYSATKAYIHTFTQALKNEMVAEKADDVEVMACIIGNTSSAGNTYRMPFTIESRKCAASCLDKAGYGETLVWAHWKYVVPGVTAQLLPEFLRRRWMGAEMRKRVKAGTKSM